MISFVQPGDLASTIFAFNERQTLLKKLRPFPPWQTVYYYLRRRQREGVWDRVHHTLLTADRERAGWGPSPTAAILDSP